LADADEKLSETAMMGLRGYTFATP